MKKPRQRNTPAVRAAVSADTVMMPVVSVPMARTYLNDVRTKASLARSKKHQTIAELEALVNEANATIAFLKVSE